MSAGRPQNGRKRQAVAGIAVVAAACLLLWLGGDALALTQEARIALLVLVGACVLFFTELIPLGVSALLIPVVLCLTGVLTEAEAFASLCDDTILMFAGMFVELTALFAIPFFLYRGLGLTGGSFWELVLVQSLVLVLSRIIMLPGNAGGAEGSFYLFMGPLFGRHLAVGLVLWRFAAFLEVLLLGGAWSVLRFAQRSAAGHGT